MKVSLLMILHFEYGGEFGFYGVHELPSDGH